MSGTSLDGIDLACCTFKKNSETWEYQLLAKEFIPYNRFWKSRLSNAENSTALDLALIDIEFGEYLGSVCKLFIENNKLKPDLIASHGHTIFHQPEKKLTLQIGNGAIISAISELPTITNFRNLDIMHGGQGAPLVPIGDHFLFSNYDFCLNLGGFANISFIQNQERIAFDICGANIVLNYLCNFLDLEFDDEGKIARENIVDKQLLSILNQIDFYKNLGPKSLGKEWILQNIFPILDNSTISVKEKIATYTEHIAIQISQSILSAKIESPRLLSTGGGAFNAYLMERIYKLTNIKAEKASSDLILFKEAIVFGFLGVLRWLGEVNCLKSVTGADINVSGGVIYLPR